jgi:hypothetical protein
LPRSLSEGLFRDATAPEIYDLMFDTTASTKFHLSFDKEEELSYWLLLSNTLSIYITKVLTNF